MLMQKRGQKSLNGFKFGTFIGHFPSDGAASIAVKGLNINYMCVFLSLSLPGNHQEVQYLTATDQEQSPTRQSKKPRECRWAFQSTIVVGRDIVHVRVWGVGWGGKWGVASACVCVRDTDR